MRISPNRITKLRPDQIFVFGSNLSGVHGAGAARQALNWGAIYRQPEGLQGRTYAIPTKDQRIQTLPLKNIEHHINTFLTYAENNPSKLFLVTEIGCGLAGYSPEQIAPLFNEARAITNVYLPYRFWKVLINLTPPEPVQRF